MKRKIYDSLLKWKQEKQGTTALLIEGALRIGKSYEQNSPTRCLSRWKKTKFMSVQEHCFLGGLIFQAT